MLGTSKLLNETPAAASAVARSESPPAVRLTTARPPRARDESLSALRHLREATAAEHAAIERQLAFGRLDTLERYGRVIATFEWFLRHWEPRVAHVLGNPRSDWLARRSRHRFARADLRALNVLPRNSAVDPAADIPLHAEASGWGSLYVMEGSALGGQVIARCVHARLGIDRRHGGAYFHGFGTRTGPMWREFRDQAEARIAHRGEDRAAAANAARATFAALARALAEVET